MEQLVSELVKVGIVGVLAAGAIVQYLRVRREKDEAAERHHKEIAALYEKHAQEIRELNDRHQEELQALADRHEGKGDKANEKTHALAERVTAALEAIGRQAERSPQRRLGGP